MGLFGKDAAAGEEASTCPQSPASESPTSAPLSPTTAYILIALSTILLLKLVATIFLTQRHSNRRSKSSQTDLLRHAVITGGSSGIGLAIAHDLALNRGCRRVTLLARSVDGLKAAKDRLEKELLATGTEQRLGQIVAIQSVDVGNYDEVAKAADEICTEKEGGGGPPSLLFNVAGTSSAGRFVEIDPTEFERLMRINYLGAAYVTRAFLPHMLDNTDDADATVPPRPCTIVYTSSAAGQVGVYGYGAYGPTKAALGCMAQSLGMEVPSTVCVQVAYPPDTDTPGYEAEQIGKPRETHLISEAAGLYQPSDVARIMVDSALRPNPPFSVYFGLEGWMLSTLTAGMGPPHGVLDVVCQIFLMGLLRFVSLFYLWDFRRIVKRCRRELEGDNDDDGRSSDAGVTSSGGGGKGEADGGTIKSEWLCGGAGW